MPRGTELTEAQVRASTSEGKPDRLIADSKQANLYLRVLVSGRKSWQLRVRTGGRWHVETLGQWPSLEVRQARLKAAAALAKLMHPSAVPRNRITVRQAADVWYTDWVMPRYRRPEQTKLYLDRDLKPLHAKPISRVTRGELIDLIKQKAPTAGNRLLAIVKQLFRYAVVRDWTAYNPLAEVTRRNVGHVERPRERVLTDDELRRAWAIPAPHGTLYRFLLATGQRLSEVLALASEPGVASEQVWSIPENKSRRPHKVPMTPLMRQLLEDGLPQKKRAAAWQHWRSHMKSDATLHDLRRTVATRMRALGVGIEAVEALLNHAPPRLIGTYQHHDMGPAVREALLVWQRELGRLVRDQT